MRPRDGAVLAALLLYAVAVAGAGPLALKDVMRNVGTYVDGYGDTASIVVCTEKYEQHADGSLTPAQTRTLVSDFALVYADATHAWLGFRDVIEVDHRAVQDRGDRLARVLIGAQGRFDEARRLQDESARFNVGHLQRNFNIPTYALFFFRADSRDRFKLATQRVLDDGTWEIGFHETQTPSLIRTPGGDPVTVSGTIWVRPADGVVVRTLLEVSVLMRSLSPAQRGKGSIDVRYHRVEALGMWLPEAMDEAFTVTRQDAWDKVTGHAEYGNYRRFETSGRIKK